MTESPQSPGPGARPPGPASPPPSSPQSSPPQSGAPGQHYGAGPPPQNGMAVAALVLGILGVVFVIILFFFPFVGLILGVLGVIFGFIGRNRAQQNPAIGRRGMAMAGLICGVIAIAIAIILIILGIIAVNELNNLGTELEDFTITQ